MTRKSKLIGRCLNDEMVAHQRRTTQSGKVYVAQFWWSKTFELPIVFASYDYDHEHVRVNLKGQAAANNFLTESHFEFQSTVFKVF
uniref:AP2/ERF domain-containing protein n=1 Tax=Ascaris lumbricoides TaxID=6252 RepID=A0A0M3IGF1_ASCLU